MRFYLNFFSMDTLKLIDQFLDYFIPAARSINKNLTDNEYRIISKLLFINRYGLKNYIINEDENVNDIINLVSYNEDSFDPYVYTDYYFLLDIYFKRDIYKHTGLTLLEWFELSDKAIFDIEGYITAKEKEIERIKEEAEEKISESKKELDDMLIDEFDPFDM